MVGERIVTDQRSDKRPSLATYVACNAQEERLLEEYKRDRDEIILSLQSALKEGRNREALDIVYRYMFVPDIDPDFKRLEQLAKLIFYEPDTVEEICIILDATPQDDHGRRIELYDQLLVLDPSNQSYKDAYLLSYRALGFDVQLDKDPSLKRGRFAVFFSGFRVFFRIILIVLVVIVVFLCFIYLSAVYA